MDIITPCRKTISERFPILSFVVRAPEARLYEIACATDPRLFHTDNLNTRTPQNFYTSRSEGLLTVNRDDNVWIMPPQQLKRFAGASNIYYALGTYAGRKGENPRFTISPDALNNVPSIQLTPDFTGRRLNLRQFDTRSANKNTYGTGAQSTLHWGGDIALEAQRQSLKTHEAIKQYGHIPYDDGFDPSLWGSQANGAAIDDDYINDGNENSPYNYSNDRYDYGLFKHPYENNQHYASASTTNEELLIQDLVTRTGTSEHEIRSFIDELKNPVGNTQVTAFTNSMPEHAPSIHIPEKQLFEGWQADTYTGLLRLSLNANPATALLANIFPEAIFMVCNDLNITLGINPAMTGGLGNGGALGPGILFAPGNRIGFIDTYNGIAAWVTSLSTSVQVTVIHGGPENFVGAPISQDAVVNTNNNHGIGIHVLSASDGHILGVTGEVSFSLGVPLLTVIKAFAKYESIQTNGDSVDHNITDQTQIHALAYGRAQPNGNRGSNSGTADYASNARYGKVGKHTEYRESNIEESLPIGPASRPLVSAESKVLDIPEKVRILRVVGKNESGNEAYSSINADTEYNTPGHDAFQLQHIGLSWGIVHFTQRSGMLGQVLKKAKERELALLPPISADGNLPVEHRFENLFGEHWQQLLNTTDPGFTTNPDDRLAPVGEGLLWQEPWLTRFRNAGSVPYIQSAQNEVAVIEYVNKIQQIANWLGIRTARGLAMLLDRVIHAGMGAGLSWIMASIEPIRNENDRRIALQAVTGNPDDLMSFQQQQGIEANGEWNAITHAALIGALRTMGEQSPIVIPEADNLLRRLLMAAQGTDFENRLQALYNDTENFDDNITYELA